MVQSFPLFLLCKGRISFCCTNANPCEPGLVAVTTSAQQRAASGPWRRHMCPPPQSPCLISCLWCKAEISGILEMKSCVLGGRSRLLVDPNGAKRSFWNVLSGVWAEAGCEWRPLFPIDLRSWQVARSQCEVGSRRTKERPHRQRRGLSPDSTAAS